MCLDLVIAINYGHLLFTNISFQSDIYTFQLQAAVISCVFTRHSFSTSELLLSSLVINVRRRKVHRLHRKDEEAAGSP